MKFTFGIITSGSEDGRLSHTIQSIRTQVQDDYQIVIVGNSSLTGDDILNIPFDESVKDRWITRKKNLITQNAIYDNIVFMHDYLVLKEDWYKGFLEFGENFDICMNKITNSDGSRFRDWTLFPTFLPAHLESRRDLLLPYDVKDLNRFQYISGSYWVAKKKVMEDFPLDESLSWGAGEDVNWSASVKSKYSFSMNDKSMVSIIKEGKGPVFTDVGSDLLDQLRRYLAENS